MSLWLLFSGVLVLAGGVGEQAGAQFERGRMVIDDNFQTSNEARAVRGFRAYGGTWRVEDGVLYAPAGPGPKLVADALGLARGEVGVEVLLPDAASGNAGLIVKLSEPGVGADSFHGYEVALDTAAGHLRLGRHRQNFESIRDVPCAVPVNRWIALVVQMRDTTLEIVVDGKTMLAYEDREHPLTGGGVAFRPWQREARYRNLWISTGDKKQAVPLEPAGVQTEICDPWKPACRGSARGEFSIADGPDPKRRAQQIAFLDGEGEVGIAHRGPDGRGFSWLAGRRYQGWLWVRCEQPAELLLAAETADGQALADTRLYFGNTIRDVGTFWQARPLPGRNDRLVATFAPHHGFPHGAIGLIDRCDGPEGAAGKGYVNVTKEFPVIGDLLMWITDSVNLCQPPAELLFCGNDRRRDFFVRTLQTPAQCLSRVGAAIELYEMVGVKSQHRVPLPRSPGRGSPGLAGPTRRSQGRFVHAKGRPPILDAWPTPQRRLHPRNLVF